MPPASVSALLMKSCCKQILFWFYFFFISLVYCVTISFIGFSFSSDGSLLLQGPDQNSNQRFRVDFLLFTLFSFSQWNHLICKSLLDTELNIRNQTKKILNIIPASPFMGVSSLVLPDLRSGPGDCKCWYSNSVYRFLSESGNFCCL